jgi:hypothetical protein
VSGEDEKYGGTRRPGRALAVAATALTFVGVAACGGDDDDSGGASAVEDVETTAEADPGDASTTTTPSTPEEQAVAAYRAAYDAYLQALNPPNPQSMALGTSFGGEALTTIIDMVFQASNQGVYVVGSMEMNPEILSATAQEVLVSDCVVETNTTYDAATNQPTDSGTYVHNRRATIVNHDGTWTVDAFERVEEQCTPAEQ